MRSKEERLERLVCAEHCRFFKPWHGEGRCGAHNWLLRLAEHDDALLENLERCRTAQPRLPLSADALLRRHLCERCDYYPDRCAYRKPHRGRDVPPCGGLIVLAMLLDRGALSEEEFFSPPWIKGER